MAMDGHREQEHVLRPQKSMSSSSESDSADGLRLNEPLPVPVPVPVPAIAPWLRPPAPTATVREGRPRVRQAPSLPSPERPQIVVPPPPPVPPIPEDARTPLAPKSPLSPLLARARSKRRTIMERIEGWWDLGLLEKRQTMVRNGSHNEGTK
ncbi:hypothetical protein ACRE_059060 [Hapsidospora chrysogenum ATCC 11550]|uniref:Uncharacterized protein n=1 Tax=Hapsidospora chrysogenum (strain ATCC 11550 / CBS 779.69 / DSM 880 / IAM 14645 / JCM 23072 / IMI 49137) TaxID=857340 RepID=A0A086T1V4_HAPC1|nr:hypothetical protein ACRE_059060 [Hapsidospora chrysogenum ATCC 11550]